MARTIDLLTLCPDYLHEVFELSKETKDVSGWTFYEVKKDYLRGFSTPGKHDRIANRITILNGLFFNTEFQMSFRKQGDNIVPNIFRVRLRNRVMPSVIITRDFYFGMGEGMYTIHSNQETPRISFNLDNLDHQAFCMIDSLLDQAAAFFHQNF